MIVLQFWEIEAMVLDPRVKDVGLQGLGFRIYGIGLSFRV
jgi:hypothetical protein